MGFILLDLASYLGPGPKLTIPWIYLDRDMQELLEALHLITREGFLRKNIVAVSFFQNCAIHQYS